ncbi:MAG: response regulator [Acidimicrobiia bacterium]|nr:response regulator [Acidimicrobiia bacterium]
MNNPRPRVMIVDDDVALRTAFERALVRVGYSVETMTGSPDVIGRVAEAQPALILLDNHMPEASGVELIRSIRLQWSKEELPIVLVSGSSIQGEIDTAMAAGANDFRRKPIDLPELLATVRTSIGRSPAPEPEPEGLPS